MRTESTWPTRSPPPLPRLRAAPALRSERADLQACRRAHAKASPITLRDRGDYLIAATAEVVRLELAPLNVRHYPTFDGLAPPFRP